MMSSPLQPMHIPDGFLSLIISILLWVIAIIAVGYSLRKVNKDLGERQVPVMGILAAAIFAGQMLNFAVAGGSSGHLMGAALATILLGPWAAILILTTVVGVQALVFQDGGLLALGANISNMAIIGVAVSYFVFQTVCKLSRRKSWGIFAGGFLAAWFSIVLASLATALELAISGTSPANITVPAMAGIHMLIGIGEGLITIGALAFLYAARRDLLHEGQTETKGGKALWVVGLLLTIFLVFLSPLASANPDGLEWVAEQQDFLESARSPLFSIFPDYFFPSISNEALATVIAGIIGVIIVLGVALGIALLRRKNSS